MTKFTEKIYQRGTVRYKGKLIRAAGQGLERAVQVIAEEVRVKRKRVIEQL